MKAKPKRRRPRKQKVVIRAKRREHLVASARGFVVKGLIAATIAGIALLVFTQSDTVIAYLTRKHTPIVQIDAPHTLTVPSLTTLWPKHSFLLWLPGSGAALRRQLAKGNPAIKEVLFEKNFLRNTIAVQFVPRTPVVQLDGQGMDIEGVTFPLAEGSWSQLPKASLKNGISKTVLGHWLGQLSKEKMFWSQVNAVTDDAMGNISVDLQTGARVIWGPPEGRLLKEKLAFLSNVLQDAHAHLGGVALADLRFFDEGRIIVRPKGVKG